MNQEHSNQFHTDTLSCSLRIISAPSKSDVVYCGIAIDAGTRDELPDENGLAHFCEHLTFKGTQRRSSRQVINQMECVGGDLNAYTGKEETIYYTAFLKEHFQRAVELLADIVLASTYKQAEMDKEVEVIIDEIESYNDSPSELIYDEFENLIFQGCALGKNILGEAERLRQYKSADMQRFVARNYLPQNMAFFLYGNIEPKTIRRELEKAIKRAVDSLDKDSERYQQFANPAPETETNVTDTLPPYTPVEITRKKDTHQAHVLIGCRSYSARDPKHLALYLLNNMLGGPGMSSRLNLSLREKNGLVYTVESSMTTYTDTGVWCIYFGCDEHDIDRCRRLVAKELNKLIEKPISEKELNAAKRQIKGQIGISYDNSENVALSLGKTFLHYKRGRSQEELYRRIDALTAEELHEVAKDLFRPENLTTLIYK